MEQLDPWRLQDPLGEALHAMRMSGAFYCRSELTEPWGFALPPMPGYLWFHVLASGHCRLEADGADPQPMRPGDFTLVPHGDGHRLRSDPDAATPPILECEHEQISDRYEILRSGGGGDRATMVCGAVRFDHPAARDLIGLLPRIIHVEAPVASEGELMRSTLSLMAAEARAMRPGGEAVITRLGDILVIQAIRARLESDSAARRGWLGALRDPQLGPAIALIHRHPERRWTLASLAAEVAMSRSAFADRFTELVGEPAMRYLARWRMHLAATALRDGATVAEVADRFAYGSEAAFSRAFKRIVGEPPGAVRRSGEDRPPDALVGASA